MIDQSVIKIDDFRGLYRRYDEDTVPSNHFKDCLNLIYDPKLFRTRDGIELLYETIGEGLDHILRIARYEIPGEDDRFIVLDENGNLFDSAVDFTTPILNVTGMTDFSLVSLFGRAYISPHNGFEGLEDTALYVYDPSVSVTARLAAGDPPSDFELSVASTIPTTPLTDLVAPVAPANGAMVIIPNIPIPPSTLKFTIAGGAVTNQVFTVVGFDGAGEAQTKIYTDIIASGGPTTYTTIDVWSPNPTITVSGLVGAGGLWRVEITGKPGGKVERGYHIIAIAFETDSGFITRPGPATADDTNYAVFLVTRAKRVLTISNIPTSAPAGVTKVHILASKAIVKNRYTGNPDEYELFFVPDTSGGIIPLGQSTAVINFFDADLVDSADFLKDNLSRIPAGVALLATSKGRLLIAGMNSTAVVGGNEDLANNTVIFGSKGGEPEAFSGTDGFVIVKPGGDGIRNLAEYRTLIYAYKDTRTYVTQDNGGLLSEWEIDSVDDSIGAGPHSIALVQGSDSATEDILIVGGRAGILPFNGSYPDRPLTWKIQELWDQIIKENEFEKVNIAVDPTSKIIYVGIPFSTPDYEVCYLLYGDYSDGLTWEGIKWCPWILYREVDQAPFPMMPTSLITTTEDGIPILVIGSFDGNIWKWEKRSGIAADVTVAREAFFETSKLSQSDIGGVTQITGVRLKISGPCILQSSLLGPNGSNAEVLTNETITNPQNNNILLKCNQVEDDVSFKGLVNGATDVFQVSRIWVFGNQSWIERPA